MCFAGTGDSENSFPVAKGSVFIMVSLLYKQKQGFLCQIGHGTIG